MRLTREERIAQHQAVLDAMAASRSHLTTAGIARAVGDTLERTRRAVRRLERDALVVRIKLTGGAARYRLADHVVVCTRCGRSYEAHHLALGSRHYHWSGCGALRIPVGGQGADMRRAAQVRRRLGVGAGQRAKIRR